MRPQVSIPDLLNLRALFVIAALICLCVSSNVGLQLFPLPAATPQVILAQLYQANKALSAPQADAKSFRVPMMVQSKKRAEKEPPQTDPFIALPSDRLGLSRATRLATDIGYAISFFTSITMAPRGGRAPPC